MIGTLTLVATPIGNLGDLSPRAVEVLGAADVIACEDTRHTRKLLSHAGVSGKLVAVHEHNERQQIPYVVGLLDAGQHVALVTDAGMPGISDPGERVVAAAAAAGHRVQVVPGPSAVVAALVVSGLPAARFCFEGFLPRKGGDRTRRLAELATERRTIVLYEAPPRVAETLADLAATCGDDRRVAVVRELTKVFEETWRGTLGEAATHWATVEPRGEFVLVVEGSPIVAATDDEVVEALVARLDAGEDRKAAVTAVAAELGVPKRQVYDAALKLRG